MADEFEKRERDKIEAKRQALLDEENRLALIARAFGTPDGIELAEWLLELCGYWSRLLADERSIGKFELGRFVFNQICMADIGIVHKLLDRRKRMAEKVRNAEKRKIEKGAA